MPAIPPPPVPTQLIVFADDWGRHPSSSQHLIRELLPQYPTLWVNTVGTRKPRLSRSDLARAMGVVANWFTPQGEPRGKAAETPHGLKVIAPMMYPGYRRSWQRSWNRRSVARAVQHELIPGHRHIVITTLPITAELVGRLQSDQWIYYCVDDYSQWPGVDHAVMDAMERDLVAKVDQHIAVSSTLTDRLQNMGATPTYLEHGVDAAQWASPDLHSTMSPHWPGDDKPIALFWGLLDSRMNNDWVMRLLANDKTRVILAGPLEKAEDLGMSAVRCILTGRIPFDDLPAHAAASQVLIMPYIDAPVTRAMQPLKLKEYLATMKPVVVRDLPSTRPWADCCDLASTADEFVRLVQERIKTGTPPEQIEARKRRLAGESWTSKAAQFAELINAGSG